MRTFSFIVFICFCFTIHSYCQQDALVLTKKKSNKEKTIPADKFIKVYTRDSKVHKGQLTIIDSSTLSVGKDTFNVSDINKVRTKSLASYIIGGTVTGGGGFIGSVGTLLLLNSLGGDGLGAILGIIISIPIIAAGVIVTTAGILVMAIGKKRKSKKWEYTIKME